jgi:predicted ATP-dependent serine protease
VWKGYVYKGSSALIAGKPKVGKSSVVFGLVRAMMNGATEFLGEPIAKDCPIVYVSEESPGTIKDKLPAHGPMTIMTREQAWPPPSWPHLCAQALAEAKRQGAGLIIIDTLRKWAGFATDKEKDASAMQSVISVLDQAMNEGIAVIILHHQRKAEGENGDAISGTNALAGAVDSVIEVERVEDGGRHRVLLTESRWGRSGDVLLFEKHADDHDYDVIGHCESKREAAALAVEGRVLEYVEQHPDVATQEVKDSIAVRADTVAQCLKRLSSDGRLLKDGKGVAGSPFTYKLAPARDKVQEDPDV